MHKKKRISNKNKSKTAQNNTHTHTETEIERKPHRQISNLPQIQSELVFYQFQNEINESLEKQNKSHTNSISNDKTKVHI